MSTEWVCSVRQHKRSTNDALNSTVFSITKLVDRVKTGTYEDKFKPPSVDKWESHTADNGLTMKRYPVSDDEIKVISPEAWKLANDVGVKMRVYRADQYSKPAYRAASGFYNKDEQTLYLTNEQGQYKNPGGLKDTLNHELVHQIQHAMQGYKGTPQGQFLTIEDYQNADAELTEVMRYVLKDNAHYRKLEPGLRKAEIEAFNFSADLSRLDPYKDRARRLIKLNNKV